MSGTEALHISEMHLFPSAVDLSKITATIEQFLDKNRINEGSLRIWLREGYGDPTMDENYYYELNLDAEVWRRDIDVIPPRKDQANADS